MKSIRYKIGSAVLVLLMGNQSIAQSKWAKLELGVGLSAFTYQGDLTTHRLGSVETIKPGILVFANYQLKSRVSLQGSFAWGALKGNDALYNNPEWRKYRALSFKSSVKELGAKFLYTFISRNADEAYNLTPYIGTGINIDFFNIKRDYSNFSNKFFETQPSIIEGLNQDLNNQTPKTLISIPLMVGVRRTIGERIDFFGEFNYRILFNDYVDGYSNAANPKRNDRFYTINVGVIYKFRKNNSIKCPNY
jgi:OmpA-OmpF porin, OOP family